MLENLAHNYKNDEFLLYEYDETTILFPQTQNPYVQIEKKNWLKIS